MMAINLGGVIYSTKAVLPSMIRNGYGRIINVSSVWGECGASCEVYYSAAKSAVIGLTKALAKEVGPSGITVNAVAPGVICTDMLRDFSQETLDQLAEETPLGRIGESNDVAQAVLFLASERASYNYWPGFACKRRAIYLIVLQSVFRYGKIIYCLTEIKKVSHSYGRSGK